ncbi:hypothetical protein ACO0LG_20495 [Undibacterium sp. Ji42W]|uniref:hypothetical protein n=1 Tax=Undibacterium sp. Ji42W TaxID=3413039 RepID=UPI003BF02FEA
MAVASGMVKLQRSDHAKNILLESRAYGHLMSGFLLFRSELHGLVLPGPLAIQISKDLSLTAAQKKGLTFAKPLLVGALLRILMRGAGIHRNIWALLLLPCLQGQWRSIPAGTPALSLRDGCHD